MLMRRILYDLTYAGRGNSGIPRDTRSLATILGKLNETETSFVTSPSKFANLHSKRINLGILSFSNYISAYFMKRQSFGIKQFRSIVFMLVQAFSPFGKVRLNKVPEFLEHNVLTKLNLENALASNTYFFMDLSYSARFLRPTWYPLHKLNTKKYDFYIQQHIDPIRISKKTTHIVRLHDILPVTYPIFFSNTAVKVFTTSLKKLLKNKEIVWVMDTKASADEFRQYFGVERKVEVIPCVVFSENGRKNSINKSLINTFLNVNTIEPRKNISLLIEAFLSALDKGQIEKSTILKVVGTYGWQEDELILKLRKGSFGKNIIFIESPNDSELKRLYSESQFILSASSAEGFGLPPLEGMSYGCIPIISDIPQHRETIGENGIYFQLNPESLMTAMEEAVKISSESMLQIQENVINYVKNNFSQDAIANQWNELLKEIEYQSEKNKKIL